MDSKDKPDELTSRCRGLGAEEINVYMCVSLETRAQAVSQGDRGVLGGVKGLGVMAVQQLQ